MNLKFQPMDAKVAGEQETFEEDTGNQSVVGARLELMAERIVAKLREKEFKGFRTVTLTVRFVDFQPATAPHLKDGIRVDAGKRRCAASKKRRYRSFSPSSMAAKTARETISSHRPAG